MTKIHKNSTKGAKMRKILVLAVFAALFVGCENNRERFVKQFSESCQYGSGDNPNADILCDCAAEFVAEQFSDKELDFMKKLESPFYQPESMQEMNARVYLKEKMSMIERNIQSGSDRAFVRAFAKYMAPCSKAKGLVDMTEERMMEAMR